MKTNKSITWSASKGQLNCPFSNLAWEENLLRGNFSGDAHFFFYRNTPSIILGRFQVPWREINFLKYHELKRQGLQREIQIVRRRSGGGTVYHDLGNWNFCFVTKQRELLRAENLLLIQKTMKNFGVSLEVNERFDLIFNTGEQKYKVSGCAFKQNKEVSLHHGTLLVDAGLDHLKGVLGAPAQWTVEGRGIRSTPSPVCNLKGYASELEFDEFFAQMCSQLDCSSADVSEEMIDPQEVSRLKSWSWLWGETPEFSVQTNEFFLSAKKGLITDLKSRHKSTPPDFAHGLRLMDAESWPVVQDFSTAIGGPLSHFFL